MDLTDAREIATNLLSEIIKSQPNLIIGAQTHTALHGEKVANFCSEFVDTFAKYLINRPQSDD